MRSFIIIFTSMLCAGNSFAQIFVKSGTVVSILAGSTVFTAGNFTNDGEVMNDGSLVVSGAWTNAGTYNAESGAVTFNGTQPQVINHNAQAFAKLTINGTGEKMFQADITINDELNLQMGILSTTNHSKIVLGAQAKITGGSASSFVQGPLYTTGTGQKFFPIGTNSVYLPVVLSNVAGTNPVVGVEAIQPNPNLSHNATVSQVSELRYWNVTTLSGTFAGSPVSLALSNETFTNTEGLVVAQAASLSDQYESIGRASMTGSLVSGTIASAEPATLPLLTVADENKSLLVYNVVTPGNDGKHDFLKIVNIEFYPNNNVIIINRWGDKVYEVNGYNNNDRAFSGDGNVGGGKSLGDGTYYYVIDKRNGDKMVTGFLTLRR